MDILIALVPPIFAGIALYFILRWINRADRSERAAQREAEKDAQLWYERVKISRGSVNPFTDDKPSLYKIFPAKVLKHISEPLSLALKSVTMYVR